MTWDPYAVLGVARDATPLQVARAHRRLAKRHHPDLHPDAADQRAMHRINAAWRVLSAPSLRADFDRRHPGAGLPPGAAPAAPAQASRTSASGGHWTANREPIPRPAPGPRSYREWRAAGGGEAAGATWSTYGYARPATGSRQAAPRAVGGRARAATDAELPPPGSFRDSGWAAILVASVLVAFLLLAASLGSQYWASTRGDPTPVESRLRDRN